MNNFRWVLVSVLSAVLGYLIVRYMTVHPLQMSVYLLLSSAVGFSLIALLIISFREKWTLPIALALSLALFSASYLLQTENFLAREDSRPVPELTRAKGDPGDGHTAVVYFTHGEPETYDPIGWINQFKEFDEQEIAFVPFIVRPYLCLINYEMRICELVQVIIGICTCRCCKVWRKHIRQEGDDTTKFYISFLDDDPRPDAAVIQALNEGASHIIVSEVFLTISNHTAEGEELIQAVKWKNMVQP